MNDRSASLDILRCLAILMVMGNHSFRHGVNPLVKSVAGLLEKGGWAGVDLFFVLSGFLISGLLFTEFNKFRSISFKNFFIRRGFKIYPPFYLMVLLISLVYVICFKQMFHLKTIMPCLLYLQDYIEPLQDGRLPHFFVHTWSLAVEEQFYILLPCLLIVLARIQRKAENPFKWIPFICCFLGIACLAGRLATLIIAKPVDGGITCGRPLHLRIDSLFFGVFVSYLYHYHPAPFNEITRRFRFAFIILGIALFVPAYLFHSATTPFMWTAQCTLLYIGSGLILAALVHVKFTPNGFIKSLCVIGIHSYSIYLWHWPLKIFSGLLNLDTICYQKPLDWLIWTSAYFIVCIGFGILMSRIIERPALLIRDRWFPSRSKPSL